MKSFDEIFVDKTKYGVKVQTTEYGEVGEHIIIDQGQSQIAGYTDRQEGLFEEVPVVIFGDHTRVIKYVDEPFFLGADGVKVLRSKDDNANYKYLYYALKNARIPDTGYNRHFKWLKEVQINYPDSDKQAEIVDILDNVSSVIKKREDELCVLDDLIKARFVEMFGDWIKEGGRPLSELATITGGLTKNSKREAFNLKMPYLRVANVFFNRLDLNEIQEIGIRKEEIDKTLLQKGDLLFVEGNGSIEQIGRVAIWDGSINPILHQNHLIKARFSVGIIIPEFALFYFMSQEGRQQIISKSVSTSGLNTLSVNKIGSLILPVPPIILQEQFADFVHQVDKSKVVVQKALDETQILFNSLMQQYFG
jgi:type I restriction enzyme S subunit